MSLNEIATRALEEIGGFDIPTSFFGSSNPTARQCLALANRGGQTIEKDNRWSELITEGTITTVAGTATYAKPADFRNFADMSMWDRTNIWRVTGPTPSIVWQWLQSGVSVASTANKWFMVRGNYITIYPTPTVSSEEIAYDYYSKYWITKNSDSTTTNRWTSDNDTALLDEDLLVMDLKWRFLAAKGMPFETEYTEFENIRNSLQDSNGGRGVIDLNSSSRCVGPSDGNLPDTGYGS